MITVYNCRRLHNTAQDSSDNLPSYPPDKHHCSDVVNWEAREFRPLTLTYCEKALTFSSVETVGRQFAVIYRSHGELLLLILS